MKKTRGKLYLLGAGLASAALTVAMTASAAPTGAATAATVSQPVVQLITAQKDLTLTSSGGFVQMDPGIWVASLRAPLEFHVFRTSYTTPMRITQILHGSSGRTVARPLPASKVLGSAWLGLVDFAKLTVRNPAGQTVASAPVMLCPNTADPERVTPDGPSTTPFPSQCAQDPFPKAMIWGIQKDWAVDPVESFQAPSMQLGPGQYQVTERMTSTYTRLFHVSAADAVASAEVTVVNGDSPTAAPRTSPPASTTDGARAGQGGQAIYGQQDSLGAAMPSASLNVPTLAHPPAAALPSLTAMPAWGISTDTSGGDDLLDFSSTVWNSGNAPLDVEGFRDGGSPVMQAYQFFYEHGRVVGKARTGTMGFDSQKGHDHWHFEQFAQYQLLSAARKPVLQSQKVGFCIAPTDPVDLLLPGTQLQPPIIGLTGQCGVPTALWVRELLQVGWGDTYYQTIAGQSFDITSLPNGTYYIQVTANPEKVLHVTTNSGDVSLRKVILGGAPGNRTVSVPAWNGIDPEG
jgi:hypothetical protein